MSSARFSRSSSRSSHSAAAAVSPRPMRVPNRLLDGVFHQLLEQLHGAPRDPTSTYQHGVSHELCDLTLRSGGRGADVRGDLRNPVHHRPGLRMGVRVAASAFFATRRCTPCASPRCMLAHDGGDIDGCRDGDETVDVTPRPLKPAAFSQNTVAAETVPLPCISTTFAAETVPFLAALRCGSSAGTAGR